MDDLKERAIQVGRAAKQLFETPLLQEAFASVEAEMIAAWRNSPAADTAQRERLFLGLIALERVKDLLMAKIEAGALTEAGLEEENRFDEFDRLNRTPGETL